MKATESTEVRAADDSAITQIQPALIGIAPRVLLVDDDEIAIERLRDLITAAGYDVATGRQAARPRSRHSAPIRAHRDPRSQHARAWTGSSCAARSASGTQYPGYVYIMLCTAHDSEDEILAGLNAGADDYLIASARPARSCWRGSPPRGASFRWSIRSSW